MNLDVSPTDYLCMRSWTGLPCAICITAVAGTGVQLTEQRLDDRFSPLGIHHGMDRRLDAYVPFAGEISDAIASRQTGPMLVAGEQIAEGVKSGRLQTPMPAYYGDTVMEGAKGMLYADALRLSRLLELKGFRQLSKGDRAYGRRLVRASLAPLQAFRYADLLAMTAIETRLKSTHSRLVAAGEQELSAEVKRLEKGDAVEKGLLFDHMALLRREYVAHYPDTMALKDADPFYEYVHAGVFSLNRPR